MRQIDSALSFNLPKEMTTMIRMTPVLIVCVSMVVGNCDAQDQRPGTPPSIAEQFSSLKFRNIGPFRGGRSNAVSGVPGNSQTYYFGSTGGGLWKTSDAGITWRNISDGFFKSGSVGAIAVAPSDVNVIYVGMGEHAVRGVMTSHGDGIYKSTDAGKTWKHTGLKNSRHIAAVGVHPLNPEVVYVAVQGSVYGPSAERGVYRSTDGGNQWERILFVNETTGAADLSLDSNNPRILYAGMWDHQRLPWKVRSGGPGSGIHKSTDGGTTWKKLKTGLPDQMGKVAVDVSRADSNVVYANIEAAKGGVFRSDNAGESWKQVNSDRATVARAWYYIEIFADPKDANRVYVLNAPVLKSIDGGRSFVKIPNPHSDQHDLWINPTDPDNIILANDGGSCITFNGGKSWTSQNNQPTAQFYRVITDHQFPYRVYGGQQDNSSISIASRSISGDIGENDWFPTAGGESAFLAFDPDNPVTVFGTSIQGMIDRHDLKTDERKSIMVYPQLNLGTLPKDQKYRFNWNGPLAVQVQNPSVLYHGANVLFRSDDAGHRWTEISKDLTRNEVDKHGDGGVPFTNEAAGGEVYNTISYLVASPHSVGTIWVGSDDGLIHRTDDEGKTWIDVTPLGLDESLINAIDLSTHDANTAFAAVTRYKFDDLAPMAFKTVDNGKSWASIVNGIANDHFVRVVRQDPVNAQVLYAGTEGGLYISFDQGAKWHPFQLNLPNCPITDLTFQDNDLIVATSGRAFWILDDLGPIQQSGGNLDTTAYRLFAPKPSFKFSADSSTPTAAPPSPLQGQNPPNGVIIDYQLGDDWTEKMTLTLEVLNPAGTVLRTLSSAEQKNVKKWEGGPGPEPRLPAKPGLNRFHWDLRTDPIPGVTNVHLMGSHNGFRVVPGDYLIRLSSDQDGIGPVDIPVAVKPDPRVVATQDDYEHQQIALNRISELAQEVHQSVSQFRQVKSQLSDRLGRLKKMKDKSELVALGQSVMDQINQWEVQLIQPRQKTQQDVINFRNQLNAELTYLGNSLDTNDPRPPKSSLERLEHLTQRWQLLRQELEALASGPIAEFNSAYRQNDLPALIIPDKE